VDLQPLGDLYKTQVRQLAVHLKIPQQVIDKPPTAGLWAGQTDESELGLPYADLDRILLGLEIRLTPATIAASVGVPVDEVLRVDRMRSQSQHKRRMPLIPKIGPAQRRPGLAVRHVGGMNGAPVVNTWNDVLAFLLLASATTVMLLVLLVTRAYYATFEPLGRALAWVVRGGRRRRASAKSSLVASASLHPSPAWEEGRGRAAGKRLIDAGLMRPDVARVYLAGPLHAPGTGRSWTRSRRPSSPRPRGVPAHRELPVSAPASDEDARKAFTFLLRGVESCDGRRRPPGWERRDPGTCVELGYAHALRRPILDCAATYDAATRRRG